MHTPVLLKEVIEGFNPEENQNYIDCTLGEGGHSLEILKHILPEGKLLGIDFDQRNIDFVRNRFNEAGIEEKNFMLISDNFKNLKSIVEKNKFNNISGILFDLGLNSYFLDESKRGFSFRFNEFLDMRFDEKLVVTAYDVVNTFSEDKIESILSELGEEGFSKNIAKEIVKSRKNQEIKTTYDLNEIVFKSTPKWYQHRKIHPSTKTFMALRIYVNQEIENLKTAISDACNLVSKNGRVAIISFHSLEDRIVKNYFKELVASKEFRVINKKTIIPKWTEVKQNKRSRSAKLRIIEKII
mgnify:FL=1